MCSLHLAGFEAERIQGIYTYGEAGDGRPAGIYKRVALSSTQQQFVPIVVFPKQSATYERRFDFYGIAARHEATHMPNHLRDALTYAKATAK